MGDLARLLPHPAILAGALGAGVLGIALAWRRRNLQAQFLGAAALGIILCVYLATGGEVLRARHRVERSFAEEVRRRYPAQEIACDISVNLRLQYYLKATIVLRTPADFENLLARHEEGILVASDTRSLDAFRSSPAQCEVTEILRAASPAIEPLRGPKDRYYLLRCRRLRK